MKRPNGEPYDDRDPTPITVPLQNVGLVEQNRGKAGALNIYKDFLRCKGTQWAAEQGISGPVQVLFICSWTLSLISLRSSWQSLMHVTCLLSQKYFGMMVYHSLQE